MGNLGQIVGKYSELDIEIESKIDKCNSVFKLCQLYIDLFHTTSTTTKYQTRILNRFQEFETDTKYIG